MPSSPAAAAALVAAVAVGLTAACARQSPPPGGPEDHRPPVVVRTVPAPFDTVTDLAEPIRFDFDERISERVNGGALRDAITISPRAGRVEVEHGRRSLILRVGGGLRPGLVYRVTLEPVVADMFGNVLADPFELVFSTGGDPAPTTLAGQVWDRISGRGAPNVTVHAVGPDSLVHLSSTDADGVYAFRYLPAGDFGVAAFEDRNRNDSLDAGETRGLAPVSIGTGDTLLVDVPVLAPDTLPAVVRRAQALDSVTVLVVFDDFLDPEQPAGEIVVGLSREEGAAPAIEQVLHDFEYTELVEAVTDSFARLDSIDRAEAEAQAQADTVSAADTVGAPDARALDALAAAADSVAAAARDSLVAAFRDSLATAFRDSLAVALRDSLDARVADSLAAAAADSVGRAAAAAGLAPQPPGRPLPPSLPSLPGARPGLDEATGRLLPGPRIVLLLGEPLEVGVEYTVTLGSVVNVNGLGGGGGETTFSVAADTARVTRPDTSAVGVDTLGADLDPLGSPAGAPRRPDAPRRPGPPAGVARPAALPARVRRR